MIESLWMNNSLHFTFFCAYKILLQAHTRVALCLKIFIYISIVHGTQKKNIHFVALFHWRKGYMQDIQPQRLISLNFSSHCSSTALKFARRATFKVSVYKRDVWILFIEKKNGTVFFISISRSWNGGRKKSIVFSFLFEFSRFLFKFQGTCFNFPLIFLIYEKSLLLAIPL